MLVAMLNMGELCCALMDQLSFYFRLGGWKDSRVECRERYEGGFVRWKAHRTNHMPAVQPQVHDICECLL